MHWTTIHPKKRQIPASAQDERNHEASAEDVPNQTSSRSALSSTTKTIRLISRSLFAIGSALAAATPTMNAFIIGKAISGIGGSGTNISITNIITALTSGEEQSQYFSYIGFMWGLGTMSVSAFVSSFFVAEQNLELDPLLEAPSLSHRQVGVGLTTSS